MNEKISIIIPAYNAEKRIERCINSILNQTYENIEVIVVDDGSIDKTYEILKQIKDERLNIYKKENGGVSSARNYGLKKANGTYIGFVDSDDFIESDMYEKMCSKMNGVDAVVCNFKTWNGRECGKYKSYDEGEYETKKIIKAVFERELSEHVWRFLYKKNIIDEFNIEFCKLKISEDMIFLMNYLLNSENAYVVDDYLYNYDIENEFSALHNMNNEKYMVDYIAYPNLLSDTFKKNERYDEFCGEIADAHVGVAMTIRLMTNYKHFKDVCSSIEFRRCLNSKAILKTRNIKYGIYYLGLVFKIYVFCDLGYRYNYIKSRMHKFKNN